jgi:hypothetical protein
LSSSFRHFGFLFTGAGTVDEKLVVVTVKTPYCLVMLIYEVRKSDSVNIASVTQCTNNVFRLYKHSIKIYTEMKYRIVMAKATFNKKKSFFTSKLDLNLR